MLVLPYLQRRLLRGLLQLQVGRGSRGGCLLQVRGERDLRQKDRRSLQKVHPLGRRLMRSDGGLRRVPRQEADY